MLLVEASRESKVRQLDVPVLVDEDVVGLDVAASAETRGERSASIPREVRKIRSGKRLTDG